MGLRGTLSPDPSSQDEANYLPDELRNVIPIAPGSDSEEEEAVLNDGYEVLPQDFPANNNIPFHFNGSEENSSEDDNEFNINPPNMGERSAFDESTRTEFKVLWNSANNNTSTDIVMDTTKEELIKSAMAGFKLPSTSIPQWAKQIPEEEWKEQLINRVNILKKVREL